MSDTKKLFEKARHDPHKHLGLGDIRITVAEQDEILERETYLEEQSAYYYKRIKQLEEHILVTISRDRWVISNWIAGEN